ncbi:MAG: hypothetical protein A2017_04275 [Lentisphaerae bacterium GWF2_44_16]|nr:MAG: hypothetical protein A2017_04275 [Lentisphaerae bacterium GWF2_44_16]
MNEKEKITVAAYYFPNFHVDNQNEKIHGTGWTEWELVKNARPRFPNHRQPRIPLWGYEDEANPEAMIRKIKTAVSYGIDAFIFDWYWYDSGPFLEKALNNGFLRASNISSIKFALMWANHDWVNLHPLKYSRKPELLLPGKVTLETFEKIVNYVIEKYFKHPSYLKINGCPYFSIYELYRFIESFGKAEDALKALNFFREKTKKTGFPDLHLNAVIWGIKILPCENGMIESENVVKMLNFDSITSYVWIHHAKPTQFPVTSYTEIFLKIKDYWHSVNLKFKQPYFPNVTVAWDTTPRTVQSDIFENKGYPYSPVIESTPNEFETALHSAKDYIFGNPDGLRLLTINAWNEWTEGSYLEPDNFYGYEYLEAVKRVFGK